MSNNLSEPELQLPDLEVMVAKAIPLKDKDCWIIRGQKQNQRERLIVQIREYAELYHLSRMREESEKKYVFRIEGNSLVAIKRD